MFRMTSMLACSLMLLLGAAAHADKPGFGDTFTFGIGGMGSQAEGDIAFTPEGVPDTELDFDELGLDDSTESIWLGAAWQFADRWRLGLTYNSFNSDGSQTIQRDGSFGDVDFSAGATLDSEFDLDLYIASLTWDFISTENAHLGVGLGLHVADLKLGLGATLETTVNGQTQVVDLGTETADVTAPLPDLVLRGGVMLGEKVYLVGSAGWFSLEYDKYDGELLSLSGMVEWRPFENFGLGLGYQYVDVAVDVDEDDSEKKYDIQFYGPFLALTMGF